MQTLPLLFTHHTQTMVNNETMQQVDSIEALANYAPGVCIIDFPTDELDTILKQLHQSGRFYNWQIYVLQESLLSKVLSDGIWPESEWATLWEQFQERLVFIDKVDLNPMFIWLWLNPDRRLTPVRSHDGQLYSYPLLNCYYPTLTSTTNFIDTKTKQNILEQEKLIDRTRHCRSCHSGHLNYVETCPTCQSVDINNQLFLHCFTCGHVAAQNMFERNNKLECPKCLSQLRHIGVDYDRPLETHQCNQCHAQFIDSHTIARCFNCDLPNDINELSVSQHHQYRMGNMLDHIILEKGFLSLPPLNLQGDTDINTLHSLLPWLNKLAIRHEQTHLLMSLHLPKLNDVKQKISFRKAMALNEQLNERLNGVLRSTDLCCQYREDLIFIFMPMTPLKSLSVLQNKIVQIAQAMEEQDFILKVYSWSLPNTELNNDAHSWLQSRLNEIEYE
ncbi:diguanylate cyclase [Vibrio sp. CK2-1]|uniref:TackOD1 domain-containing metal-binding protein n=1 Tax=Vibrio sp. CK2-1 TaxID=2912249 RepID=UPI001F484925|nr:diguanylate cyclase [Vibrio sp. CK2-1]MCF7352596.1 diguanylate cyclase [Vibrio sp. CK2-1]